MAEEKLTLIDMDNAVREACEAMNLKHYKSWNFDEERNSGFPNWCIVKDGRIICVELKTDKYMVTKDEDAWIRGLGNAGAYAWIVRGEENLKKLIDAISTTDEVDFFWLWKSLKKETLKELGRHGFDSY